MTSFEGGKKKFYFYTADFHTKTQLLIFIQHEVMSRMYNVKMKKGLLDFCAF